MTGAEALIAYGYTLGEDGIYRRTGKRTQEWKATDGGWLRFDDGKPTPHSVDPESPIQAGIDAATLREAFIWVYPDAEIARIYGGG